MSAARAESELIAVLKRFSACANKMRLRLKMRDIDWVEANSVKGQLEALSVCQEYPVEMRRSLQERAAWLTSTERVMDNGSDSIQSMLDHARQADSTFGPVPIIQMNTFELLLGIGETQTAMQLFSTIVRSYIGPRHLCDVMLVLMTRLMNGQFICSIEDDTLYRLVEAARDLPDQPFWNRLSNCITAEQRRRDKG